MDLSKANTLNTDDLRKELISSKGCVGQKVADCVLFFSQKTKRNLPYRCMDKESYGAFVF